MPNWKKLLVSGSDANLSNLNVDNSVSAVSLTGSLDFSNIVNAPTLISSSEQIALVNSASYAVSSSHATAGTGTFNGQFTGTFSGDGSNLTGITVEQGITVTDTFTNTTSKVVVHNFDTKNVIVSVYNSNDEVIVPTSIVTTNTNSVTVTFNVPESGRVVVAKGGHIVAPTSGNSILFNGLDTGSFATTGSNLLTGTQTLSGSLIPAVNNAYDLGSPTKQWRDLYLSSASLYIDGTKVISSDANTLTFTTDVGQSIKLLETGADDITFQTDAGNIELKGTVEILSGKKILDSAGTVIQFGDSIGVTGSIVASGTFNGINLTNFSSSVVQALSNADINSGSFAGRITANEGAISDLQSDSGSFESRITPLETFSSSLETTILTLSGSFSGSFVGDGSQLSGVTSYTDDDTLAYINSLNVLSGSAGYATDAELNASSSALIVAYGQADANLSSSIAIDLTAVSGGLAGRVAQNEADIDALQIASGSFSTRVTTNEGDISNLQSDSGSFSTRITPLEVLSSSLDTAFNFDNTNVSVAGNLEVLGTASFGYITSVTGSAKVIGDNYLILNADTPTQRYSGLRVYDSGSAGETGSLEYDSIANHWFYESANEGYAAVLMSGPKATRGALSIPTSGSLVVASGNHLYSSNISDLDGLVKIQNNTQITGSLGVSGGITGALTGNASTATSASHAAAAPYSGLYGTVPTWNQNTTGNAATATSASHADAAPYSGLYGTVPTWNQDTTGNAATATSASYASNADTVDSLHASSFVRSDAADTFTGKITGGLSAGSTGIDLATNDNYFSARVIQNPVSSGVNSDGLYIGYENGNSAITRIFGGGATSGGIKVNGGGTNDVTIADNIVWHAGNLTNLNQLTNGPGYITGYSETDTLATVTARGATTTADITVGDIFSIKGSTPYIRWQNSSGTRLGYIQHNETDLVMSSDTGKITLDPSSGEVSVDGQISFTGNGNNIIIPHSSNNTGNIIFKQDGTTYNDIDFSAINGMIGFYNVGNSTFRWKFGVSGGDADTLYHAGYGGTLIDANGDYNGTWQGTSPSTYATLAGSNSFSNSYNEFGNGVGSVSNDGSWNGRLNLAGSQHARLDVTSVSDGIITSLYSHTGQAAGKVGTMSNHPVNFMVNGSTRAVLDGSGNLYASAFIDNDDAAYYINPNSISRIRGLSIAGNASSQSALDQIGFWAVADGVPNTTSAIGFKQIGGVWAEHGYTSAGYNTYFTMDTTNRGWIFRRATNGGSDYTGVNVASISNTGNAKFDGLVETPKLYLNGGSYEGSILFGSEPTWRCGIRQHDDADAELRIWARNNNGMIFLTTGYDGEPASISRPTDGLVVGPNNRVGVGNFSSVDPAAKFEVKSTVAGETVLNIEGTTGQLFSVTDDLTGDIFSVSDVSGIPILNVNSDGTVTVDDTLHVYGDVTAYYSSDERLKKNIKPIENPLEKLKLISGNTFEWDETNPAHKNKGKDIGVIAQEIEQVLPEIVKDKNSGYKGVQYEKIVALLIESNKALLARVEELESKLK